jgi:hypothetical protein
MAELSPELRRRTLVFLAGGRWSVGEIAEQGIAGEVLSELVKAGLASKFVQTVGRGADAVAITPGWKITPAGRRALRET